MKTSRAATIKTLVAIAVLTLWMPASAQPPAGERWAVIIGVYDNTSILPARYAVADAEAIYNIKWALGTFLAQAAKRDDLVLIYFACHGGLEVDQRGLERDGLAKYLIPRDVDPDDLYSTALSMEALQAAFARIEAESVIVFLDVSYSGAAGGRMFSPEVTRPVDDLFLERLARSKGRAIVASSRPTEMSVELGHGIFTYYLLEGLKGAADRNRDGVISLQGFTSTSSAR
jgi:uncharacterized caspase-like protein